MDTQQLAGDALHVKVGQPVSFSLLVLYKHYNLMTNTAPPFSLTDPLVFALEIRRDANPTQSGDLLWKGALPPLSGTISSINARFRFVWDQRDAAGKQVPPGTYDISLPLPLPTAHYLWNGQPGQEQLPTGSMGQRDSKIVTISN